MTDGSARADGGDALGHQVDRFDHVAIAVHEMRAAAHLFHDVLGGQFVGGGEDPRLGITTIQLRFPSGSKIELMAPARPDSFLHGYLDKHGPGFHHAAMFVTDLRAAVARLEEEGYEVVDGSFELPHWYEAYLRPRSAFGALIQLVETTRDWSGVQTDLTLQQVLDGEVVWVDSTPTLRSDAPDTTTPDDTVTEHFTADDTSPHDRGRPA